jgi:hypothetical protein
MQSNLKARVFYTKQFSEFLLYYKSLNLKMLNILQMSTELNFFATLWKNEIKQLHFLCDFRAGY